MIQSFPARHARRITKPIDQPVTQSIRSTRTHRDAEPQETSTTNHWPDTRTHQALPPITGASVIRLEGFG